jgi:hypothetical protein
VTEQAGTAPQWQLVLILWGDKYGVDELNALIRQTVARANSAPRVVLISDRDRPGLLPLVLVRPFPEFFLRPEFCTGGCQAKLAMFEAGVVPDDLPAIYLDLDTLVLGDITALFSLAKTPQTVAIFQSALLPFGALGRALWRWTGGRRYARGNSSIVVYHPAHCGFIAARFRALFDEHGGFGIRPMIADERFISWVAQPVMRAIPRSMAVKFPTEFMTPWRWLNYLRGALPWNRRRWAGLIAVTFPGLNLKGQDLAVQPEGFEFIDSKGRRLIWSDRTLGPLRRRTIEYYSALIAQDNTGESQ